jgi:hypothetical protein
MAKLNKRQIIILIVMVIVVIYGAYEFIIGSSTRKKGNEINSNSVEINAFVSGLTNELAKDSSAGTDTYIISRAEADWQKNPFLARSLYKEWSAREGTAGKNVAAVKIIYSGYVDSGKKKMAIINGIEYGVGEKLEIEGYVLKRITNSNVVVSNRNTGSEVEVPIQE